MTELAGRELDAAIARGLGWEVKVAGRPREGAPFYACRIGDGKYFPCPEFHCSLDALVEHCGPRLFEHGYWWAMRGKMSEVGGYYAQVKTGKFPSVTLPEAIADTPALALARAILIVFVFIGWQEKPEAWR